MAEHSATPWQLCHHLENAEKDASCKCGYRGGIWGESGEILVCEMRNCDLHEGHDMTPVGDRATQLANAAFIVKAVNNHDALLEFFRWSMREGPWDGGDLDGASIQDKAESLGLIVKTQYDAEKHGIQSDFETGDDWFEYKPDLRRVVSTQKEPS